MFRDRVKIRVRFKDRFRAWVMNSVRVRFRVKDSVTIKL